MILRSEAGTGRTFILLVERPQCEDAQALHLELARKTRSLVVESAQVLSSNWPILTQELLDFILEKGLRQITFVAWGAAATLVMNVALLEPKLVRSMVVIEAGMRPRWTWFTRCIDWLEKFLPLGLPLRLRSEEFDARSLLQRIRCPVLVVTSARSSEFLKEQADEMLGRLPTAWRVHLPAANSQFELCRTILEFQEVPAKAPQRQVSA
jgi:pimeloyl-ACP methyl ester carboxylesterase